MDRKYLNISLEVKTEDIKSDGTFKGYGSLFDKSPDSYGDVVARGAFTETLAQGGRNKTGIAMLWQHRSDQIPGVWTSLAEDKRGLKVEGKLALKTQLGNDVYEIMKLSAEAGTFKLGLSIGYDPIDFEIDPKTKIRTLKEVSLWEISIVSFPAKIGAGIESIKGSAAYQKAFEHLTKFSKMSPEDADELLNSISKFLPEDDISNALTSLKDNLKNLADLQESYKKLSEKTKDIIENFDLIGIDDQDFWALCDKANEAMEIIENAEPIAAITDRIDKIEEQFCQQTTSCDYEIEEVEVPVIPKKTVVLTSYEKGKGFPGSDQAARAMN